MATQLLYQGDSYLLKCTTNVLTFRKLDRHKALLILDSTIFYPQGGGQPSDVGIIKSKTSTTSFSVTFVRYNMETGQVEHEGVLLDDGGTFMEKEEVELSVDKDVRMLHSRIHSAGHLLDHAIDLLGIPLETTKAYHFPDSPYVEYKPKGPADLDLSRVKLEELKLKVEEKCKQMIVENRTFSIVSSSLEELDDEIKKSLPEKLQHEKIIRLVYCEGAPWPRPCGGTHIAKTGEIGTISIRKAIYKGGILRLSYSV